MIHFHATPITPRIALYECAGRHFLVSFANPQDADICPQIGQSVLWDNGAFTIHTQDKQLDRDALFRWLERRLSHPHRAVITDVINGSIEQQRYERTQWPFPRDLSWPVWHLDKPLDYLAELVDNYPAVCFGSARQYWEVSSLIWCQRMDEAFNFLARRNRILPWVHGLRMLDVVNGGRWPLSSADSANAGRNHKRNGRPPIAMISEIDRRQTPSRWEIQPEQLTL